MKLYKLMIIALPLLFLLSNANAKTNLDNILELAATEHHVDIFIGEVSTNEFGWINIEIQFVNTIQDTRDLVCRFQLIGGIKEVAQSFAIVDDLEGFETAPDQITFTEDNVTLDAFDSMRINGCMKLSSNTIVDTPEPDFDYLHRRSFVNSDFNIGVYILGYTTNDLGYTEVNAVFQNYGDSNINVMCNLQIIDSSGKELDYSLLSVANMEPDQLLPDTATFVPTDIEIDDIAESRISGCN